MEQVWTPGPIFMRTRIWKQGVCFFVFFYYQILVVTAWLFQIENAEDFGSYV